MVSATISYSTSRSSRWIFPAKITVLNFKQIYFDSQTPDKESIGEPFQSKLSPFQRLLVLRCLRPDKMISSIQEFITNYLGPEFIDPPTFDIMSSYKVTYYDVIMTWLTLYRILLWWHRWFSCCRRELTLPRTFCVSLMRWNSAERLNSSLSVKAKVQRWDF